MKSAFCTNSPTFFKYTERNDLRILFQYFTGGGGALSNICLLLNALSREYPLDHIDIVCSKTSGLCNLQELPNVDVISYRRSNHQEINRLFLGFGGLSRIAKDRSADLIWSLNLGSYVQTSVPQVLSVNNSHQVYPWRVTRFHPDSKLKVLGLRWFFRKSLRVADGVIVQTPRMGEYIRNIIGAPKSIEVVPKAVENVEDVVPSPLPSGLHEMLETGLGGRAFTFLYVSTFTPHKNHKTLVDVLGTLAKEVINTRAVLTIERDELIACGGDKARRLMQSGHLIPIGWAKKEYLKSLYDACDACLMPSVLESLSSAHLEAMQWSKPQIVSDLPYAKDLCGEAAVYAQAEDPTDWAQKIREFISDEKLRERLVTAGHERMKQFPLAWAEAAINVHSFLEEILMVNKGQS